MAMTPGRAHQGSSVEVPQREALGRMDVSWWGLGRGSFRPALGRRAPQAVRLRAERPDGRVHASAGRRQHPLIPKQMPRPPRDGKLAALKVREGVGSRSDSSRRRTKDGLPAAAAGAVGARAAPGTHPPQDSEPRHTGEFQDSGLWWEGPGEGEPRPTRRPHLPGRKPLTEGPVHCPGLRSAHEERTGGVLKAPVDPELPRAPSDCMTSILRSAGGTGPLASPRQVPWGPGPWGPGSLQRGFCVTGRPTHSHGGCDTGRLRAAGRPGQTKAE